MKKELDRLGSFREKLDFLKAKVVLKETSGPWKQPSNTAACIGAHTQAEAVELSSAAYNTVTKIFKHNSIALHRTLSVYGHFRETRNEAQAPIPKLYAVKELGGRTIFTIESMGPDYEQFAPRSSDDSGTNPLQSYDNMDYRQEYRTISKIGR